MKRFTFIIPAAFLLSLSFNTVAQENTENEIFKNTVYGTVGTAGLWFTANVNYERYFAETDNIPGVCYAFLGYGAYETWGAGGPATTAGAKWVSGKNNSHLEIIAGISILYDKDSYLLEKNYAAVKPVKNDFKRVIPAGGIGYRYQKPGGRFVFRTGLASPDGLYLSSGFAF